MMRSPVFAYITGNSLLPRVSMTWKSVLVLVGPGWLLVRTSQ
jgi:hypothetical protein